MYLIIIVCMISICCIQKSMWAHACVCYSKRNILQYTIYFMVLLLYSSNFWPQISLVVIVRYFWATNSVRKYKKAISVPNFKTIIWFLVQISCDNENTLFRFKNFFSETNEEILLKFLLEEVFVMFNIW